MLAESAFYNHNVARSAKLRESSCNFGFEELEAFKDLVLLAIRSPANNVFSLRIFLKTATDSDR